MVGTWPHQVVEFDRYISPDGEEYEFHDGFDHFLMTFEGQGMPSIDYKTQRGPFQHGSSLVDYFLTPRVIQLAHRRQALNRQGYWDARSDLLDFLRPNRQSSGELTTGILRKVMPDGTKRDLNVMITEGPKFGGRSVDSWDEFGFTEILRFIAFDPVFFNPTQLSLTFTLGALAHLVFPVTLTPLDGGEDMVFFSSSVDEDQDVTYQGTWLAFPTIVLTGPMENIVITNETTDETLEINRNLAAGETLTINLAYGNKTVTLQDGSNLIGSISEDSDLGTFHLAPDPEAPGGVNTISVVFTAASAASGITMSWYDRYIGI